MGVKLREQRQREPLLKLEEAVQAEPTDMGCVCVCVGVAVADLWLTPCRPNSDRISFITGGQDVSFSKESTWSY